MLVAVIMGVGLMVLTAVSVDLTMVTSVTRRVQQDAFVSRQIADSGASQALAKIKEGGFVAPFSGSGASPGWVSFSSGDYYYYTNYDPANGVSTIRAWGKVAVEDNPSTSTEAPGRALELTPATVTHRSKAAKRMRPSLSKVTALSLVRPCLQLWANNGKSGRKLPGVPRTSMQ